MTEILRIDELPPEHPLRNKPLAEIGAMYRYRESDKYRWHEVTPKYKIADKTFNELGGSWTASTIWGVRTAAAMAKEG